MATYGDGATVDLAPPGWGDFALFFEVLTGDAPFPYQRRFACGEDLAALAQIPTGLGKTAMAVLGWLWRRRYHPDLGVRAATPRRLIYCLPMRVLVEQTFEAARGWRDAHAALADLKVFRLMGGETGGLDEPGGTPWDALPEADAVIVGTQDQLLSRGLNRGYAMSRFRWSLPFAWLNSDACWIVDEPQLMGPGLETTAQLAGLRRRLGCYGPAHTLWMSATLASGGLDTADHRAEGLSAIALDEEDRAHAVVARRLGAKKALAACAIALNKASAKGGYGADLAEAVAEAHATGDPGGLTLVVVNQVRRAQDVARALRRAGPPGVAVGLVHGRMRPMDRRGQEAILVAEGPRIVVATQVVEAGVDVSASTLFTELAPWASLVQRFGRCNRRGVGEGRAFWIDMADERELVAPYGLEELEAARTLLRGLVEVGPEALEAIPPGRRPPMALPEPHGFRRKDLLELFDSTPDLLGQDLDVARYIRDAEGADLLAYWRETAPREAPDSKEGGPRREELCPVGVGAFRAFLKRSPAPRAWRWDAVDEAWRPLNPASEIRPGVVIRLARDAGGYDDALGWTGEPGDLPSAFDAPDAPHHESLKDDRLAMEAREPVTLAAHTDDVVDEAERLAGVLGGVAPELPWLSLHRAARCHDWGKVHPTFVADIGRPEGTPEGTFLAKSKQGGRAAGSRDSGGERKHRRVKKIQGAPRTEGMERPEAGDNVRQRARHELASALAYLQVHGGEADAALVAYLIAAHHGKVRTSLRAQPNEPTPPDGRAFAHGCWEGDALPAAELGGGVRTPALALTLAPARLGEGSWSARVLALRDAEALGPFRLAYLEALLRVADWRGSARDGNTSGGAVPHG